MSNITIIESFHNPLKIDVKELWRYRELLWSMSLRDFKIRYSNAALGLVWAFLMPAATIGVLWFIIQMRGGNTFHSHIPSIVLVACGYTAWSFFQTLFTEGGSSIIQSQNMVRKIYFPRLILPLSKSLTGLIDFGISLLILVILIAIYGVKISPNIIYLPLFVLLVIMCGLAGGLWVSALSIRFRDFKIVTPLISRMGLFLSCIMFPFSLLSDKLKIYFSFNPLVGVVEGFRWSILGEGTLNHYMFISLSIVLLMFVSGIFYFNSIEKKIADLI